MESDGFQKRNKNVVSLKYFNLDRMPYPLYVKMFVI